MESPNYQSFLAAQGGAAIFDSGKPLQMKKAPIKLFAFHALKVPGQNYSGPP